MSSVASHLQVQIAQIAQSVHRFNANVFLKFSVVQAGRMMKHTNRPERLASLKLREAEGTLMLIGGCA